MNLKEPVLEPDDQKSHRQEFKHEQSNNQKRNEEPQKQEDQRKVGSVVRRQDEL